MLGKVSQNLFFFLSYSINLFLFSTLYTMLMSSKVQLAILAFGSCFLLYFFFNNPAIPSTSVQWNSNNGECSAGFFSKSSKFSPQQYSYYNMNNDNGQADVDINKANGQTGHVLILTPFKQSVQFIDKFFDNVNKLTYPHHLISLGFLVSDSTDGTIEKLRERAEAESHAEEWRRFHKISIFQKDYKFDLASNEDRHAFEVQVKRRNIMAKSRNTLLSASLNEKHEWVLWLDGDVTEYPETLLEELISLDKDVIVPNCYWHSYNEEGGYDKNNWQETKESWDFQKTIPEDQVLVEGKSIFFFFL